MPAPPDGVQRDFPLARLATVRTGGPADLFARVGCEDELQALLAWARDARVPVAVVGSGSNLLVADEGVRGLVLKLDGALAGVEREGERLLCGGGARLPAVAAQAARAGLAGIEFGVNIPGTVGGAVRMNANAYGGELASTLQWALVVTAEGARRRVPRELGFAYRSSNLRDGEIIARACFALRRADPDAVRATLAELRARRHEAQPQGIKTFGSTFKNPSASDVAASDPSAADAAASDPSASDAAASDVAASDAAASDVAASDAAASDVAASDVDAAAPARTAGMLLARAGCNGLRVGGARFAPKHANFVENTGTATTADIVALMSEGRRRVLERFGVALEPEVQTLGDVRFPWVS